MTWHSILDRFRPAGAPGPVAPAGVPAQDATGPRSELAPVFAALQPDVQDAESRASTARARAAVITEDAHRRAAELLAEARAGAHRERLAAVEEARVAAMQDGARATARAQAEAAEIRARAAARSAAVTARAVAFVLAHGTPDAPPVAAAEPTPGPRGS
jgi:hypothetical protein